MKGAESAGAAGQTTLDDQYHTYGGLSLNSKTTSKDLQNPTAATAVGNAAGPNHFSSSRTNKRSQLSAGIQTKSYDEDISSGTNGAVGGGGDL